MRDFTNDSNFQQFMVHVFAGALIKCKQHYLIGIWKQASKAIYVETCSYAIYNYTMPLQNPNHGKVSDAQNSPIYVLCSMT